MFANRISSSTGCSIWLPETSPPSSSRGVLRHRFQSCNTSFIKQLPTLLKILWNFSDVCLNSPNRRRHLYLAQRFCEPDAAVAREHALFEQSLDYPLKEE